jgi:hypothetical protein
VAVWKTEVRKPITPVFDRRFVVEARLETYKSVEVAEVVVALVAVKRVSVDEAVETKPLLNSRVVEVAFSPLESFTNGKENPPAEATGQALLQSPAKQIVSEAKLVEVALVVVALVATNLVKVEDAVETKPLLNSRVVEVACSPELSAVNGQENPPAVATGQAVLQSPLRQRFVVAKLVVVAEVPVAFWKVKFWRVDDPVIKRFKNEDNPERTLSVPVRLAELERVCPLMSPELIAVAVREPMFASLAFNVVEVATSV